MKKRVGVVLVLLVVGFVVFLSQQKEGKLGELAKTLKVDKLFKGGTSSDTAVNQEILEDSEDNDKVSDRTQKEGRDKLKDSSNDKIDRNEHSKAGGENLSDSKSEQSSGSIKNMPTYKPGSKIPEGYEKFKDSEIVDIKSYNQGKIDSILPETRWSLKKSECKDLIKTRKGASFTCRTKSSKKIGKAFIIHESSYDKNGKLIKFETKVQGVDEAISYYGPTSIRKSQGKTKKSKISNDKAAKSMKFALEGRHFYEVYLDNNYMTEEVQYHYYDFKQAIITDEFYKEKDFQDRLDAVILSIDKTMKMVEDQCKLGKYEKACVSLRKYQKINLKKDAKKIISAAESAKLESAFFD